jgi:hypothetical protein
MGPSAVSLAEVAPSSLSKHEFQIILVKHMLGVSLCRGLRRGPHCLCPIPVSSCHVSTSLVFVSICISALLKNMLTLQIRSKDLNVGPNLNTSSQRQVLKPRAYHILRRWRMFVPQAYASRIGFLFLIILGMKLSGISDIEMITLREMGHMIDLV